MKFEWHIPKAESNIRKHGVSFDEAATIFEDSAAETFLDPLHSTGETRYLCVGMSDQSRVLAVIYTERQDRTRIISAREANRFEEHEYYEARSSLLN